MHVACDAQEGLDIVTVDEIIEATGGKILSKSTDTFKGISIDSRTIEDGELFVPLKGDRTDGHQFINSALMKGYGTLVDRLLDRLPPRDKTIIFVRDTLRALQDIARFIRLRRNIPTVAITGSNGKTTTKELIAAILGKHYKVQKNAGNLNNHIGLPLSITALCEEDEVLVLEMGASSPGEIRTLCDIAQPQYGVVTNIGMAHLEGFGSLDAVRKTKLEMLEYVTSIAVNADDPFLMEGMRSSSYGGSIKTYGMTDAADVQALDVRTLESGMVFKLKIHDNDPLEIATRLSGSFNIYNALAAATLCSLFHVDVSHIKEALETFQGVSMRFQWMEIEGVRIINDVYNANPSSMEEALKELIRVKKGRTIAVLGDMLELGSYAEDAHLQLGRVMKASRIDIFIAVGPLMQLAASEFEGTTYGTAEPQEAGRILKDIWQEGDTVLVKGSRGMHMEKVFEGYAL